jgi:hypothetical protein
MLHRSLSITIGALVLVTAGGCASQGPKPTDELTKAHAVVEQADKGNAQRYAAADLQRAHDELSEAERADAQQKYLEARYMAQRSEVDADVALARANSAEAQKNAAEVRQSNATLQEESQRGKGADARGSVSAPGTNPQ